MVKESPTYPLIEAAIKCSRLPRFVVIAMIAAILLAFQVLTAYLDGVLTGLWFQGFWRGGLSGLILIIYILVVYPIMVRFRDRAAKAFRPLFLPNDGSFDKLVAEISRPKRRWEWTAIFVGLAFAAALGQPWNYLSWGQGTLWQSLYQVIETGLFFSLLGWLVYTAFADILYISRLSRQDLKLNILDTELLTPIARWSLVISFAFVGGISLSLIFQTQETLLMWNSITVWAVLICVTVLLFFMSMWSPHRALASAKKQELALVRRHLTETSLELKDRAQHSQLSDMERISYAITSWSAYNRLVQEAPTWPFNAGIIRRLVVSSIVPAIVYVIKIISGLGLRF